MRGVILVCAAALFGIAPSAHAQEGGGAPEPGSFEQPQALDERAPGENEPPPSEELEPPRVPEPPSWERAEPPIEVEERSAEPPPPASEPLEEERPALEPGGAPPTAEERAPEPGGGSSEGVLVPDAAPEPPPVEPAPGEPAAPPEPAPDGAHSLIDGFANALRELTQARPSATEPAPTERAPELEPTAPVDPAIHSLVSEWLGIEPPPSLGLLLLLFLSLVLLWIVERARRPLPERGLFPRALGLMRFVLRFAIVLIALMALSRLLPAWLQPALLLVFAAIAVALGFGVVWVLLPDLIAGLVLLTEGRLERGQWVAGEGFAGTVERLGARVTSLRAADGSLIAVPNRRVVESPVRANERAWHEVDVELRVPVVGVAAARLREAIREAVITSPYVPPDPNLVMVRDPRDPERWRLTARLVHARFSAAFEGQLLERVEEALDGGVDHPGKKPMK